MSSAGNGGCGGGGGGGGGGCAIRVERGVREEIGTRREVELGPNDHGVVVVVVVLGAAAGLYWFRPAALNSD